MLHKLRFGGICKGTFSGVITKDNAAEILTKTSSSFYPRINTGSPITISVLVRGAVYNSYFNTNEIAPPEESKLRTRVRGGSGSSRASSVSMFEVTGYGTSNNNNNSGVNWASLEW